jgi:hypothetical protein
MNVAMKKKGYESFESFKQWNESDKCNFEAVVEETGALILDT